MTPFLSRRETFERVGSTNDVVAAWLESGTPEICLAVADEQAAGRGRDGRRWEATRGSALLLSLGFRPTWLEPDAAWQLAGVASLAMAEAAEAVAGLAGGTVRLKWPNDLVIERAVTDGTRPAGIGKLAGVLGETVGLGSDDPRVVVGLGLNAGWPAADFPPALAAGMTSLHEASGGRPIDSDALLEVFIAALATRVTALRDGMFDAAAWTDRQITTGRVVRLDAPAGDATVRAVGADPRTGALIVEDRASPTGTRSIHVGEISHVRLAEPTGAGV